MHTESTKSRFMLIGGNLFQQSNGTSVCTSLRVIGYADTSEQCAKLTEETFDQHGGILLWVDRVTGLPGEPTSSNRPEVGSLLEENKRLKEHVEDAQHRTLRMKQVLDAVVGELNDHRDRLEVILDRY